MVDWEGSVECRPVGVCLLLFSGSEIRCDSDDHALGLHVVLLDDGHVFLDAFDVCCARLGNLLF